MSVQEGTGATGMHVPSVPRQIWVVKIVLVLTFGLMFKLLQKWILMLEASGKNVRWLLQMSAAAWVFYFVILR